MAIIAILAAFLFVAATIAIGSAQQTGEVTLRSVQGNSVSVNVGEEIDLSVFYSKDPSVLSWSSHHPTIATVVGNGTKAHLTAHIPGTAVLKITDGNRCCNILVTVTD